MRISPLLAEGKEEVKVIVTKEVLEKAKTVYPDLFKKCMELGEYYVCEGATEWFWVSDRQLTLFFSSGGKYDMLNVLICNNKEGIEWGVRLFDHYLENSTKVVTL
jgi:predicted transcriptional regulator